MSDTNAWHTPREHEWDWVPYLDERIQHNLPTGEISLHPVYVPSDDPEDLPGTKMVALDCDCGPTLHWPGDGRTVIVQHRAWDGRPAPEIA